MAITVTINGEKKTIDVESDTPILWALRDHLQMTGTKFGCGVAQCGACTVHLNGQPIRGCVTPISAAADAEITTVEGVSGKAAAAVKNAWKSIDVPQCGYCQSGQIMSAVALLKQNDNPSDADIDAGMQGNICRCATYVRIRKAIKMAGKELRSEA